MSLIAIMELGDLISANIAAGKSAHLPALKIHELGKLLRYLELKRGYY
ncbi:Uncharacterised protein [Yersinia aldovae]|nr:hypothetical protein [Yersinia aldovae]CNK26057.1 Uncharacterised protein [Yersinia aldovae]